MPYTERHTVTLVKPALRNLNEDTIKRNTDYILVGVNNRSLTVAGWRITSDVDNRWTRTQTPLADDHKFIFHMHLHVTFTSPGDKHPDPGDLHRIIRTIDVKARHPKAGQWDVGYVDDSEYHVADHEEIVGNAKDMIGYAEVTVPDDWEDNFSHLFGLTPHVQRVRKAVEAGIQSQWSNRFNVALVGPPGCGKSDICASLKRALGDEAVMEFDATATTGAGAIKELSEREILPRVIVVEEIEKAPEAAFQFLLGVLDLRGEIRKTTHRATIQRSTKCLAIATVNDVAAFEKLMSGALASRFTNRVHFNRPSRETLAMILRREITKVNGNPAWIAPALDYCADRGIDDPRQVIALCLCGGDDLLDGTYQAMLEATSPKAVDGE